MGFSASYHHAGCTKQAACPAQDISPSFYRSYLWCRVAPYVFPSEKRSEIMTKSNNFLKHLLGIQPYPFFSGWNLSSCASCDVDRSSTGWRQQSRHFLEPTSMKALIPVSSHGINTKWQGVAWHSRFLPLKKTVLWKASIKDLSIDLFFPWQFWKHGENLMALVFWCCL